MMTKRLYLKAVLINPCQLGEEVVVVVSLTV